MKNEWTLTQSICALIGTAILFLLAARLETLASY